MMTGQVQCLQWNRKDMERYGSYLQISEEYLLHIGGTNGASAESHRRVSALGGLLRVREHLFTSLRVNLRWPSGSTQTCSSEIHIDHQVQEEG